MLPRPPNCCRAVQRQRLTPSDSIWVSDRALSVAFHHFCATSRAPRRYGSSVPGPMESRRKLGRRRMAHISEPIPTSPQYIGSIWGSFRDPDRTQWQWQPPKTRPSLQDAGSALLPAWLFNWEATPEGDIIEALDAAVTDGSLVEETTTVEDDIRSFREAMKKSSSRRDDMNLCIEFSRQFKQNLSLGLVSSDKLSSGLHCFSRTVRELNPNYRITSYVCLAFYTAVWDGITACKVLPPVDFTGEVMNQLLSLIAALPVTMGMQALSYRVLHSTSVIQLQSMEQGIILLVKVWADSWREARPSNDRHEEARHAESSVAEAEDKVMNAQILAMALEGGPKLEKHLGITREAISSAHAAISVAIDATVMFEDVTTPLRASVKALAGALGKIPRELLSNIIPSCSDHIMTVCEDTEESPWPFRYCWLSTIAQMPYADDQIFVQAWQKVDISNCLRNSKCSDLVLSHWISQGHVTKPAAVRNTFEASAQIYGRVDFGSLLLALDKHRERSLTKTRTLFELLHKLGRYRQVYSILSRMEELNLKVTVSLLGSAIETMSNYDPKRALDMYYLPFHMRLGYPLRPDWIPNFIISLIKDPKIAPKTIWALLRIPAYEEGPSFQPHFAPPLPQTMINLISKMAIAFARSEARPTRVALRNVVQCLHHLRIHRAPISHELARAIGHAGITRSIIREQFVGQERLRYALFLIADLEGEYVADKVDGIVRKWRQHLHCKRERQRRDRNVLRVGPID